MTKIEAENIIKNYKDYDDETGEQYGYIIVAYEGIDNGGNHLFRCKTDCDDIEDKDCPIIVVTDEKNLL